MVFPYQVALGRAVSAARMLAGWDQATLAAAAGVSGSTISNVERGSDARESTIRSVRRALRKGGITLHIDKTNGTAVIVTNFEQHDDDD